LLNAARDLAHQVNGSADISGGAASPATGLAGFGSVSIDAEGNAALILGVGVGVGAGVSIGGTAELRRGEASPINMTFFGGPAVPTLIPVGAQIHSNVSLLGGSAGGSAFAATGAGAFVFYGPTVTIPLGQALIYFERGAAAAVNPTGPSYYFAPGM
jgi:hypothetical protein